MGAEQSKGGDGMFTTCCDSRDKDQQIRQSELAVRMCGVGMGLDSQLLAKGRGAVVTCLAKGGPAESDGQIQIGDSLVYVDDLDVRELMNNPEGAGKQTSTILANALLGTPGSTVRLGLIRQGEEGLVYRVLSRAPLQPNCQW
eukprot:CAMPEP_0173425578 /NCGR_PEP_ID=MMETSP1357-20121228/5261_1 /TAXON_ID=77926 /ORGANISM="Hemiselmis rufescens, Strain PCC563" /LENGTH=142 /DNA_ID=CAMNT_0014389047 /DNA_START=30 /DNA_END=455 /DNA_ORIENTATION=-